MTTITFFKNEQIPQPNAMIFDWDNTLINSKHCLHLNINRACKDMNEDSDTILLNRYFESKQDPSLENAMIRVMGEDKGRELFKRYLVHFHQNHLNEIYLNPGALSMLKMADAAGIPMTVLSNKEEEHLKIEVDKLGVAQYFKKVSGFCKGKPHKPSKEAAIESLDNVFAPIDRSVWFLGDSDFDIMCANEAGCTPILFGPINTVLKENMMCHHVHSFKEFNEILQQHIGNSEK